MVKNQAQRSSAGFTPKAIAALIACHVAGLVFLPAMPLVMGAFVSDFAANSHWLGRIASLQLLTTACGALCFSVMAGRFDCRKLVLFAISTEIILNIATANANGVVALLTLRGLSGFAQGTLLAAAGAGAALTTRTEKTFAWYNIALATFAVIVLICGATVVPRYGNAGVFGLIVCVDVLTLLVVLKQFPSFRLTSKHPTSFFKGVTTIPGALQVLFALGLFGVALSGTQTFMERLGFFHGSTLDVMALALACGWCIAVASPFLLLLYCSRARTSFWLLSAAYGTIALLALALSFAPTAAIFLVAMALFTPVIMFIEPLQFGVLGRLDDSGRLAALGPAAISVGCGAGPLLTSMVVNNFSLVGVGLFAGLLFLLSFILLYPISRASRSEGKTSVLLSGAVNK
ncbi:MFS transporter [Alteromonas sp. C1M14]|uniref:MFS transporter n=1 Tax=Alteromonas sp. C1M14 TaxID=2841567 RepID=UPI001C09A71B|nr:MFS transporter [Alteromonas sp. C1M14]MBU2979995.1 MFS transporter [Alteromonas sp. C1M14]